MDKSKVLSFADYRQIVSNCKNYLGSDIHLYLDSEYSEYIAMNPNFLARLTTAQQEAMNHPDLRNTILAISWNKGSVSDPRIDLLNYIETWIRNKQPEGTQPIGLKCKNNIQPKDLKFIFSRLKGKLHKSVTEINFVNTFQEGALSNDWKPLKWTGTNPELATLVNELTGEKPVPSLINKYFKTESVYTNSSPKGAKNPLIKQLITAALK